MLRNVAKAMRLEARLHTETQIQKQDLLSLFLRGRILGFVF